MLAAVFGDTHGHLNTMYYLAAAWEKRTGLELDLIIQVGDFGFWLSEETVDAMTAKHAERANAKRREAGEEEHPSCGDYPEYVLGEKQAYKKTLVIRGNHEDQRYLMGLEKQLEHRHPDDFLTRTIEVVPNIFYLPDGHVTEVDGVRFGALGGNFSLKTWEHWDYWDEARFKRLRYGEQRRLNHFTRDRWEALAREKMDVLLFHDAPTGLRLVGGSGVQLPKDEMTDQVYGECGSPQLRELIEIVRPRYTFCGHWHQWRKEGFNINKHGNPDTQVVVLNKTDNPPAHDCMMVVEL